jgi:glycosyltransferase involved in cell wall biosynthesis
MREESMLMLYVGRISAEKEIDVLFNAIEILSNQNLSVKLAVVGDGPYRQELESRGFSNVTFLGYKTGKELQRIYASSDIFVFPSSSETYGNVILEAMASGLPVVAPYAGGIKENLIHEQNGLAFKTGDAADMAQKIKMVLKDQNLRDRLAVNARKSIERKTWDSIFSELFNCYAAVLDQQKPVVKRIA